jgi:hypothetical protein
LLAQYIVNEVLQLGQDAPAPADTALATVQAAAE